MRTIGGGHEVPWPELLTGNDHVFLKDYRMNAFPRTSDGRPWFDIPDDEYFAWLAAYLPDNLPELTRAQQELYNQKESFSRLTGFWIGDLAGWYEVEAADMLNYEFPADFIERGDLSAVRLRDGAYTYDDYVEANVDIIDPGELLMTPEEFILNDFGWRLVLEEEKRQFALYWPEFIKFDDFNVVFTTNTLHHEPPDAGWRVYLGMALQKIQDKAARIHEIEQFYRYWQEMISK
jgi:hypothetical protein